MQMPLFQCPLLEISEHCKPSRLGEGDENRKFPKVLRRGCKRSFGPREPRSLKSLLHLPKPLCTGATLFCTSARGFLLAGSKQPFASSPKHFLAFLIFVALSQAAWFAILACLDGHLSAPLVHLQEHDNPFHLILSNRTSRASPQIHHRGEGSPTGEKQNGRNWFLQSSREEKIRVPIPPVRRSNFLVVFFGQICCCC